MEYIRIINLFVQEIDYNNVYLPPNVSLYDSTQIMDPNPIKTAIVVCNKLIKEQVKTDQKILKSLKIFSFGS